MPMERGAWLSQKRSWLLLAALIDYAEVVFVQVGVIAIDFDLCLAKRSYTCEINDLAQSLIRSFPLKFLP